MMKIAAVICATLGSVVSSSAYAQAPSAEEARVNQLIVYGQDACPPGNEEEIIVCARLPEEERFRIPPSLRDRPDAGSRSWHGRAIDLSYAGRSGIGSCTPTGAGGFIGCQNQIISQARAERRAEQDIDWSRLVAEARADRSRRIDRDAAEIERAQSEDE
jgi:hypothetical protein